MATNLTPNVSHWTSLRGVCLSASAMTLALLGPLDASAEEWSFALGLGVGLLPDYEGSDDYDVLPFPQVKAEYGARFVELTGTKLRANVLNHVVISTGPVINYRGERDDVDEDAVDDLDDVDAAVEVGGFVDVFYEGWLGTFTVTQDVADGHDGLVVELGGGYWTSLSPELSLITVVTASYADDNYMDAYFGIDDGDALASGLDEFDPDAGFKDVGLTLELAYALDSTWGVAGIASYQWLLDDAADSPVVDDVGDENQTFAGLLVSYSS